MSVETVLIIVCLLNIPYVILTALHFIRLPTFSKHEKKLIRQALNHSQIFITILEKHYDTEKVVDTLQWIDDIKAKVDKL
jgi:ABC-type protease/lipase transport system fused ATPase/permease subunit